MVHQLGIISRRERNVSFPGLSLFAKLNLRLHPILIFYRQNCRRRNPVSKWSPRSGKERYEKYTAEWMLKKKCFEEWGYSCLRFSFRTMFDNLWVRSEQDKLQFYLRLEVCLAKTRGGTEGNCEKLPTPCSLCLVLRYSWTWFEGWCSRESTQ